MNIAFKASLAVGILVYFLILLRMVKKNRLSLKLSLPWLFCGVLFIILDIFPEIVKGLAKLIGLEVPSNGLFMVFIFLLMINIISLYGVCSRQQEKIRELTQELGLLEKRVRSLEK